jgi:hypothetical protein
MAALRALGLKVRIWTMPVEVQDPIPFDKDDKHHTYVPEQAQRFWRILKQADRVLQQFRCGFVGKCGAFFKADLAVRASPAGAPPRAAFRTWRTG